MSRETKELVCPKCQTLHTVYLDCPKLTCVKCGWLLHKATATFDEEPIESEARRLIGGDRKADYGQAKENFDNIALAWTAIIRAKTKHLHITLDAETVGLMMSAFKIIRECNKHKRDNLVDGVAYLLLAKEVLDDAAHASNKE